LSVYVVDASVAAKWFARERHAESSLGLLSEGNRLHAPDFFVLEMDSVLCKWIRRGVIAEAEGDEIRSALERLPIQKHPFSVLRDSAYRIANRTGRGLYDCLYVALAALVGGPMVTADRSLYEGIRKGRLAEHVLWVGNLERRG